MSFSTILKPESFLNLRLAESRSAAHCGNEVASIFGRGGYFSSRGPGGELHGRRTELQVMVALPQWNSSQLEICFMIRAVERSTTVVPPSEIGIRSRRQFSKSSAHRALRLARQSRG